METTQLLVIFQAALGAAIGISLFLTWLVFAKKAELANIKDQLALAKNEILRKESCIREQHAKITELDLELWHRKNPDKKTVPEDLIQTITNKDGYPIKVATMRLNRC